MRMNTWQQIECASNVYIDIHILHIRRFICSLYEKKNLNSYNNNNNNKGTIIIFIIIL